MNSQPAVLPASVTLPVALCPQLEAVLAEYVALCRGGRRPAGAPGRILPVLQPFVDAVSAGSAAARAYAARPRAGDITWIDVPRAAALLVTSPAMVQRWLRARKLDGEKVGRVWRVDVASVEAMARGGHTGAASVRGGGRG